MQQIRREPLGRGLHGCRCAPLKAGVQPPRIVIRGCFFSYRAEGLLSQYLLHGVAWQGGEGYFPGRSVEDHTRTDGCRLAVLVLHKVHTLIGARSARPGSDIVDRAQHGSVFADAVLGYPNRGGD